MHQKRISDKAGGWIYTFLAAVAISLSACSSVTENPEAEAPAGSGGVNAPSQQDKPYLILISIDGFRWDYMDLHPTPAIDRLALNGVRAERLLPVFPTLTFPNHYSLATGLYPANHGLVANDFPLDDRGNWYHLKQRETVENGNNYRGEPIWVTAEKQGMVTASYFWVGTEADVQGIRPTHWRSYDKSIAGEERVDQVLAWLAEPEHKRPHLYTLYFEDVDDYTHWYGPDSTEASDAIARVDTYIERLMIGLENLPHGELVNMILVSDHGQGTYIPDQEPFVVEEFLNLDGIVNVEGGCYLFLNFDTADPGRAAMIRDTINNNWDSGKAYLPDEAPAGWHISNSPRFPDVIVQADPGYGVIASSGSESKLIAGDHGWPPEDPNMHGFFVAHGPSFKRGLTVGPVNGIDVYPLLLNVLSLDAPQNLDADPQALTGILR